MAILFVNIGYKLYAQETPSYSYHFADIKLHSGATYYSGDLYKGVLGNNYNAVEFRYGWHTVGNYGWEGAYNYPSYGVGWYSGYVKDRYTEGNRNAVYGFMNFPLSKKDKRNVWMLEPALGLSFNPVTHNPANNITNYRTGSRITVYFNLNIGGELKLGQEWDFIYGIDLTHFSNGRTVYPNYGLNMAGANIGARFHFNRARKQVSSYNQQYDIGARPPVLKTRKPIRLNKGGLQVYQAFGRVQLKRNEATGHGFLTSSTVLEGYYRFSEMHGITAGADVFIDKSLADKSILYNPDKTICMPGLHAGYGFSWWRITTSLQIGYLLTERARELKSPFFVRPAIRFDITEHIFAQIGLKTYRVRADWAEFGLGVKIW